MAGEDEPRIPNDLEAALREESRLRMRAERREKHQRAILEQLAKGQPLEVMLRSVVALVEEESVESMCSILILDASRRRLRHGAAPHLPASYSNAIDGVEIGPQVGSCGAAAYSGKRVIAEDIETHPYWAPYRELARSAGVRSCWSEPILSSTGHVIGTFAIYHRRAQSPTAGEIDSISVAAHLAGIAIERTQEDERRRRLEAQLQHAQKLESLGVLAGGIAHDFNNLLTSILGHADLALRELPRGSNARELVDEAVNGARRAAELTQQMLAYSGKGRFVVEPLDLSTLTAEIVRLLEVSISKRCVLKLEFEPNLPRIEADAGQIRQIVMNLVMNASEAMGDASGSITVRTGIMHCDRAYFADTYVDENLTEGEYVFLEVADTGCGMSDETRARIFDPFFTTKFTGRGLGLSAILGIVRGHRGAIRVHSELGKGTSFRVVFPSTTLPVRDTANGDQAAAKWRGHGLVLVVDDEKAVRGLACRMLETMGFTAISAADGHEAISMFDERAGAVLLVLLDMTMPLMDGLETLRELRRRRADVRVILSSGYDENTAMDRFADRVRPPFIQKPYRFAALASLVRDVIGRA